MGMGGGGGGGGLCMDVSVPVDMHSRLSRYFLLVNVSKAWVRQPWLQYTCHTIDGYSAIGS